MKQILFMLSALLLCCCSADNEVKAETPANTGDTSGVVADAKRLLPNVTWMGHPSKGLYIKASSAGSGKMHAGVAQLAGVHPVEVGGIVKRMICAKSENRDVFCETQVPDNHRTFAASNLKNDNHLWKQ